MGKLEQRVSTSSTPQEPRRRLGGRSARVREAVLNATVAELEEVGYEKFSIPSVAARAEVHETSIYRRWRTREGLVTEATYALVAQRIPVPDTGSLSGDLVRLSCFAGKYLKSPLGRATMQFSSLLSQEAARTREMHEQWERRMQELLHLFERAQVRGEWPEGADPVPVLQALIGVVYLRVFIVRMPVTPRHMRPLVEVLLRGSSQFAR